MKRLALFICLAIRLSAEPDYLAEGAPDPGREWKGSDYAAFAVCLKKHPDDLPTYATARGSSFLQRAFAQSNFTFYQDAGLPLKIRLDDYLKLMAGVREIEALYVAKETPGTSVHKELCEGIIFMLQTGAQAIDLIDLLIPTIAKDEFYEKRMAGVVQFKAGMTTMFNGAEQSLSETNVYSPEELAELLRAMDENLAKYNPQFSASYRKELTDRLTKRQGEFKSKPDQDCLARMLKLLSGS